MASFAIAGSSLSESFESWPPDPQAESIAGQLRDSRLTLVYGAPDCGMTTLLKTGILPSLRRRWGDFALAGGEPSSTTARLPDRRRRDDLADPRAEVSVYDDAWTGSPVTTLRERILESLALGGANPPLSASPLAASLAAWSKLFNVRFLIIFDHFEEYLKAPLERSGIWEFAEEWVRILEHPSLPVNFLICVRDDARPLMDQFAERIAEIGRNGFHLPRLWNANFMVLTKPETNSPPWISAGPQEEEGVVATGPVPTLPASTIPAPPITPITPITPMTPMQALPRPMGPAPSRRPVDWRLGLLAAVLLSIAAIAEYERQSLARREPANLAPIPVASAPGKTPGPEALRPAQPASIHVLLMADPNNATDLRMAHELAAKLGSSSGSEIGVFPFSGLATQTKEPALSRLAILPSSALDEARAGVLAGKTDATMHIVTPLYADDIFFMVRADSPLAFIHEIRGWEINVGPRAGSRAASAELVYREMFDAPIPKTTSSNLEIDDALRLLVADQGVDVVVLVAPQSSFWRKTFTPELARSIKFLRLERANPASARALRSFVPATVHASADSAWRGRDLETLAAMSFLVALDPPGHAEEPSLKAVAQVLCADLPELRRNGDPKWRQVQLGLYLEVGWPYSMQANEVFRACNGVSAAPRAAAKTLSALPR